MESLLAPITWLKQGIGILDKVVTREVTYNNGGNRGVGEAEVYTKACLVYAILANTGFGHFLPDLDFVVQPEGRRNGRTTWLLFCFLMMCFRVAIKKIRR